MEENGEQSVIPTGRTLMQELSVDSLDFWTEWPNQTLTTDLAQVLAEHKDLKCLHKQFTRSSFYKLSGLNISSFILKR